MHLYPFIFTKYPIKDMEAAEGTEAALLEAAEDPSEAVVSLEAVLVEEVRLWAER